MTALLYLLCENILFVEVDPRARPCLFLLLCICRLKLVWCSVRLVALQQAVLSRCIVFLLLRMLRTVLVVLGGTRNPSLTLRLTNRVLF